jgi:hypothetical protein
LNQCQPFCTETEHKADLLVKNALHYCAIAAAIAHFSNAIACIACAIAARAIAAIALLLYYNSTLLLESVKQLTLTVGNELYCVLL